MRILILDNEKREVQMKCGVIDLKKFGVDKIYCAYTWSQTFELLELHPITVLLIHNDLLQKGCLRESPDGNSPRIFVLPVVLAWERRCETECKPCDSTVTFCLGNEIPEFWWKSLGQQKMLLFLRILDHPHQISIDKLEKMLHQYRTLLNQYQILCYVYEPLRLTQVCCADYNTMPQQLEDGVKTVETLSKIMPKLKTYINENLEMDLTRSDLAAQIYVHPDYLSHIFKEKVGMSVSQYIMHARLEESKILLRSTKKSISEISHQVGYPNTSYFSRLFKRATGMTPTEYRKRTI